MNNTKRDSFASAGSVARLAFSGQDSHQPRKESRRDHGRCAAGVQVVFPGDPLEAQRRGHADPPDRGLHRSPRPHVRGPSHGAVRSQARHRAALVRFLAQVRWSRDWAVLTQAADLLLQAETRRRGAWIFIVDRTDRGQQGQKTENTFGRANYRPRPKEGPARSWTFDITEWIWAAGACVACLVQLVRVVRLRGRLKRGLPAPPWLEALTADAAAVLKVRPPRVLVLRGVSSPMVCALGGPRWIWPMGLVDPLPADGRRAVLLHELEGDAAFVAPRDRRPSLGQPRRHPGAGRRTWEEMATSLAVRQKLDHCADRRSAAWSALFSPL